MNMRKRVVRVLIGIPKNRKHIRTIIEFESGEMLIFNEAELSNITRAFIHILTHPLDMAIELKHQEIKGKTGFNSHQLVETTRDPIQILGEMHTLLGSDTE